MTSLRVMTWNLENLYPAGGEYGPRNDTVYQLKMVNCAGIINQINPDIVVVQEVGNPDGFADLVGRLNNAYSHSQLSTNPDGRGIRVGFISKIPIADGPDELVNIPADALTFIPGREGNSITSFGRGAVRIGVTVNNQAVYLITVHLKSKFITYEGGRRWPRNEDERARETGFALLKRTAEAIALRVYINDLVTNNQNPLIVLGDLNDIPEAVTTEIIQGPYDRSLSHPDRFDDIRLYNLVDRMRADRKFSRIYNKKQEMIDHIMVSYELIFNVEEVDSHIEIVESIDETVDSRRDAVFPDHAPVIARFEI